MTKIKLADGTIINAETVEVVKGTLKIATVEKTVEELDALFSNKENTARIVLMTESGEESGYKTGFTSFAGIYYDADGTKTVELFQPKDVTEARLSNVEGAVVQAGEAAVQAGAAAAAASNAASELESTVNTLLGITTEQEV